MNVNLPPAYQNVLAREIAKTVHAAVIAMHLRLAGHGYTESLNKDDMQEVRTILRSIPGGSDRFSDRRDLVRMIRHAFEELRKERGTEPRWQEYVAKVRAVHPQMITAECEAKLAASKRI